MSSRNLKRMQTHFFRTEKKNRRTNVRMCLNWNEKKYVDLSFRYSIRLFRFECMAFTCIVGTGLISASSMFAIEMERARKQTNDFLVYNVNIEIRNRDDSFHFTSFVRISSLFVCRVLLHLPKPLPLRYRSKTTLNTRITSCRIDFDHV